MRHVRDAAGNTVPKGADARGQRVFRVYAPRFASVRSISQPVLDYSIDKPAGAHDGVLLAGLARQTSLETQAQTDQLSGINMRSRASGDMYIEIAVETPVNLTKKQQELLREFEGAGKSGKTSPQSEGFFAKVKEFWEDLTE